MSSVCLCTSQESERVEETDWAHGDVYEPSLTPLPRDGAFLPVSLKGIQKRTAADRLQVPR